MSEGSFFVSSCKVLNPQKSLLFIDCHPKSMLLSGMILNRDSGGNTLSDRVESSNNLVHDIRVEQMVLSAESEKVAVMIVGYVAQKSFRNDIAMNARPF